MYTETISINLDLPPSQRWEPLIDYQDEINALLSSYLSEYDGAEHLIAGIEVYKTAVVAHEYLAEIDFIASISDFSPNEVLTANLYYDLIKFYFGCTAFAVEAEKGILHARNLDWWTENNLLSKHSKIFDFQRGGKTQYKTVGWPGFIGALSGMKPQHFSLSLNAVLSNDTPQIATPISFFLREVLETADAYEEAKQRLAATPIATDCLLLIAGTQAGEIAVIERTPLRSAIREPKHDFITVTNDYKLLENHSAEGSQLQATSCGRYERANTLLEHQLPSSAAECIEILTDEKVIMGITVQQMVFHTITGNIELIRTGDLDDA